MNKNTFLHTDKEKIQQNLSLNLNNNTSQSEKYKIVSIKLEIYEAKLQQSINIEDFSPYITITIGKDTKKTSSNNSNKRYNPMFNEVKFAIFFNMSSK